MTYRETAGTGAHRTRATVITALVTIGVTLTGALIHRSVEQSSAPPASPDAALHGRPPRPLGEADGAVPEGVTVFDDGVPAVANLDPDLLAALRRAATDAADDRVAMFVSSGWRSPQYQERLLREAVRKYGSAKEAARWAATPETSPHVSGDAIDIRNADATAWLSEHGADHGLCQIYRNESWHYELRPDATDQGCPPMYADPTEDPRMRQ
ncbi:M15 family metallopeptidase [Streptomyces sp. NPDC098781]|uniref:M15 family metallopeptidase n=1 Tax=Streptomyces sp. NPDC098781 TaxID=3366097 RepID=UPI00382980FF